MICIIPEDNCCICLDPLKNHDCLLISECKHAIHIQCSASLKKCPLCRAKIENSPLRNNPSFLNRFNPLSVQEPNPQLVPNSIHLPPEIKILIGMLVGMFVGIIIYIFAGRDISTLSRPNLRSTPLRFKIVIKRIACKIITLVTLIVYVWSIYNTGKNMLENDLSSGWFTLRLNFLMLAPMVYDHIISNIKHSMLEDEILANQMEEHEIQEQRVREQRFREALARMQEQEELQEEEEEDIMLRRFRTIEEEDTILQRFRTIEDEDENTRRLRLEIFDDS